jgi:glycerol-3-phosphate dehydrogenase
VYTLPKTRFAMESKKNKKKIPTIFADLLQQVSGVRGALSCHTYTAARLAPYALVTRLLAKAVSQGVNLQTNTPVESVRAIEHDSHGFKWAVDTPRGTVKAKTVIYATNGYTAALVPEMSGKIVPVRGMVARLAGPDASKLKHSYMMRMSDHEYEYMIPRPDGSVVVGGGRRDYYKNLDDWFNVVDDSRLIDAGKSYYDGYMQRHFYGWENSRVRTEELWTGSKHDPFPLAPLRIIPRRRVKLTLTLQKQQSWVIRTTSSLM